MTDVYDSRGPGIRVPPPLIYLAGFGAGALAELAAPSPSLPLWSRLIGAGSGVALLLALDTFAGVRFRAHRTPFNPARPAKALVVDGPYRFTRNPMYLGMACAYGGAALGSGWLWPLLFLPAVLAIVDRLIIPREERQLVELFGDEYKRYRSRVRRWL